MFEAESKNLSKLFERTAIIAIGPETAEAAVQCFGKCDGQAVQFTQSGLIEAVLHHVQNKTGKGS
jgi:uroporphyrinogen-III synthase